MVSDGHDAGDDDYDTHVIFFFFVFVSFRVFGEGA